MAGAPVWAPGTAASARTAVPSAVPSSTAVTAAARVSGGRSADGRRTKAAATGMVRVMPEVAPERHLLAEAEEPLRRFVEGERGVVGGARDGLC